MELARRALSINERSLQALNALGSALHHTGDLAGAKEAYDKALDQHPNFVPCILNLAQVYLAEDQEEKMAELCRRVLAINPRQPQALFNLGTYKATRGQPDEAISLYRRAVAADPDYAIAHTHLGMLLLSLAQNDAALYHIERSLALEPDQPDRERLADVAATLRQSGFQPSPETRPANQP
jgi:tetratricopeptide (TPR) repeat protein